MTFFAFIRLKHMSDDYKQTFLSVTFRMIKEEDKDHVCVCVCVWISAHVYMCVRRGRPAPQVYTNPVFMGWFQHVTGSAEDTLTRSHYCRSTDKSPF